MYIRSYQTQQVMMLKILNSIIVKPFLVLFICISSFSASGQSKKADDIITNWVNQEILRNSTIVIYFQDAETGESLGEYNADLCVATASTLKLWTTATALEMLSPEYRFSTKLAYSGTIKNDTLNGDLIIIGGGDPALGSKYFKEHYSKPHFIQVWIDSLQASGIKHINGNLIADVSVYDKPDVPDRWSWDDIGNHYGALPSGLSVYDNLFEIHFNSPQEAEKQTHVIYTKPEIPNLRFDNRVLSSEIAQDLAFVYGSPFDEKRIIKGTIPKGQIDFAIKAAMPDPPNVLLHQFKDSLNAHNISLEGTTIQALSHPDSILSTTFSPSLSDIIKETNHESINLFADHMIQHLAYIKNGKGNLEDGVETMIDFWKSKGIDTHGLYLNDGSGLSRYNAVSGRQMVSMLAFMKNQSPYSNLYFQTLPTPPDGTLYYFNPKSFPRQSLRTKSGSIGRVRCFAGLIRTASNKEILFDIALNNYFCTLSEATKAIEKLLLSIYSSL